MPSARIIRPKILVMWNAVKGGVDEYSRALRTFAMTNVSENPLVSIIGRMLSTQIPNAALVYRLWVAKETGKICEEVEMIPEHQRSYAKLPHRLDGVQNAGMLCRRLAEEWEKGIAYRTHVMTYVQQLGTNVSVLRRLFARNAYRKYNKAHHRSKRLNQAHNHISVKAQSCYCSLCGFTFMYRKKTFRTGAKQNKWCMRCRQPICVSCLEEWHSEVKLSKKKASVEEIEAVNARVDNEKGSVGTRARRRAA